MSLLTTTDYLMHVMQKMSENEFQTDQYFFRVPETFVDKQISTVSSPIGPVMHIFKCPAAKEWSVWIFGTILDIHFPNTTILFTFFQQFNLEINQLQCKPIN